MERNCVGHFGRMILETSEFGVYQLNSGEIDCDRII